MIPSFGSGGSFSHHVAFSCSEHMRSLVMLLEVVMSKWIAKKEHNCDNDSAL